MFDPLVTLAATVFMEVSAAVAREARSTPTAAAVTQPHVSTLSPEQQIDKALLEGKGAEGAGWRSPTQGWIARGFTPMQFER